VSYIGNQVTTVPFITDTFSGNSATTNFTLTRAPAGSAAIAVYIAGVYQAPTAYSVTGTTLTFVSAPVVGTNNIVVLHLGNGSATQVPSDGSVTLVKLSGDTYGYINAAFSAANTGSSSGSSAASYANSAFLQANTPSYLANSAGSYANSGFTTANSAGSYANSGFAVANSAASYANSAFATANTANTKVANVTTATGTLPEANGGTGTNTGYYSFKNRIINGAMVIDQRNAGASVTIPSGTTYTVDRWACDTTQASKFSVQQSSTAPTGFKNSTLITSLSSYSVGTSDYFLFRQAVEGLNFADLAWGTASAATVTLSFWVRSSLTGTFGGVLSNGQGSSRSYPFSYAISAANTWEQKTITVAGDTTGTWLTTTGTGIVVYFGLGVGSTLSGTANAWAGTQYLSATGATSVVGTNGATFYITGVQLEKGSAATSFDYRDYGRELEMCLRYYSKSYEYSTATGTATYTGMVGGAMGLGNCGGSMSSPFPVTMRTAPTMSFWDGAGTASKVTGITGGTTGVDGLASVPNGPFTITAKNFWLTGNGSATYAIFCHYTASAEL